jgi:hypothetical protein
MLLWAVHIVWVINPLENGSLEDGEREVTFRDFRMGCARKWFILLPLDFNHRSRL